MKPDRFRVGSELRLDDIDPHSHHGVSRPEAEERTAELSTRLGTLQERLYAEGTRSVLVILQGRDASGKDGTVKHVFGGLNPQGLNIVSFGVPTADEAARDFLWRVHARVPAQGRIAIFNRSHYEDVLVPTVNGTLPEEAQERRMQHIVAFESLLASEGTCVLKLFLHISRDEQLERLSERIARPDKQWKFDPADLTARARWEEYTRVYERLLTRTSSPQAPWYVIPADRKWFRNLVVSQILVDALEELNPQFPSLKFDPTTLRLE